MTANPFADDPAYLPPAARLSEKTNLAPDELTPEQRFRELAALEVSRSILARGVQRLGRQIPTESPPPDLDLPRETVLSVHRG